MDVNGQNRLRFDRYKFEEFYGNISPWKQCENEVALLVETHACKKKRNQAQFLRR